MTQYTGSSIGILKGLEGVRKRPGMYIGDTDNGDGLHHLVHEVVDNSVDEHLAGFCSRIDVALLSDGSVAVSDNGRGIPVDIIASEGRSAAEVVMTVLHAGGKFNQDNYNVSAGLHGIGVSAVNALSEWLKLDIHRDGYWYHQDYVRGIPQAPLAPVQPSAGRGTIVQFKPDKTIFKNVVDFSFDRLAKKLQELAYLNSGLYIAIKDYRNNQEKAFQYTGGYISYVVDHNAGKNVLHNEIISMSGQSGNIGVDVAMQWTDSFSEDVVCFTNTVRNRDGGTHLAGFKNAITRAANTYATEFKLVKDKDETLSGDDLREGLVGIVSVRVPDPKYDSQAKHKLISSEVTTAVADVVGKKFKTWLDMHPKEAKVIILKAQLAAKAREAARKARELVQRKGIMEISSLPGKLADCSEHDPQKCELFIVEGESAGGSAKQGRDRRFQAILPLRGKIMNVEKVRLDRVLSSQELATLITAMGAGIGQDKDLGKLRYHKIILMADADVDGAHIRTLLLTFFYRHFTELFDRGNIFIAQPPLYKIKRGKVEQYIKNESAMELFQAQMAAQEAFLWVADPVTKSWSTVADEAVVALMVDPVYRAHFHPQAVFSVRNRQDGSEMDKIDEWPLTHKKLIALGRRGTQIQRYKGLGEMSAEQLWTTTLNPAQRSLLQVKVDDAQEVDRIFSTLMGDEVEPRRRFIEENALHVRRLDV